MTGTARPVVAAAALALAASALCGETVTTRLSARGDRPAIRIIRLSESSAVLQLDLSALAGKRIYSARLRCQREPIDGADEEAMVDVQIFPLGRAYRKGAEPRPAGRPLRLIGPWYRSFEMTNLLRAWLEGKAPNHGLYVKSFPKWRPERTCLDVTHEGALDAPPPTVKELKAFHRSGQTFLTWREIDNPLPAKSVPWGKLREILEKLDQKRQVRYRIYRHKVRITPQNLHEAELIAEVRPLSAFNVNARCIEYGIDRKLATADVAIPRRFDPFEGTTRESGLGLDYPVSRFVIDEKAGPLPPGTGLYVHTATETGSFFYAVTVAIDGAESSSALAALAQPVAEAPAEPEPVLQGRLPDSPYWKYPAKRYHYVQWCGPGAEVAPAQGPALPPHTANLPNVAYSYGVSVPDRRTADGRMPLEIHFHARGFSYYRPALRIRTDSLVICPCDFPNPSAFYGYHESLGTLKSFAQGVVRNYTERRILAFIAWARRKWKIDPNRISVVAGVPGGVSAEICAGTEALWFGLAHRDFVNVVMCSRPAIDTSTMPPMGGPRWRRRPSKAYRERQRAWGRREWNIKTADGRRAWTVQDCIPIVEALKPAEELPFIAIGGNTPAILRFVSLLREQRRGLWHLSSWGGAPLAVIDGTSISQNFHCGIRRDRSYPALTHCSTDSTKHPTIEHSARARWDGQSIVDRPDRYEVTIYTWSWYPTRRMTAKVTLRRLQNFIVKPAMSYRWRIADPAKPDEPLKVTGPGRQRRTLAGTATAGADGLLTIEGCEFSDTPRRLIVQPASGE